MELRKKIIDLKCISDARLLLLGIATLLVTFYHCDMMNINEVINIGIVANVMGFIKKLGNYGVDVFLVLSGIGLFFSISKNKLSIFYKNRFIRIIPEFVIITVVYAIITKTMTAVEVFETLFFISFFIKGDRDIWFMPFIMVLYLLFPLIYKIIKKYDFAGLLSMLLFVFIFNLLYLFIFPDSYGGIEVALTRIPVFLCGTYLGKMIYQKEKLSLGMLIASILIQVIIIMVLYISKDITRFNTFARYIYCLLAVSSVINISVLFSLFKNKKMILIKILEFFGKYSLEIYLIFEKVEYVLKNTYVPNSIVIFYILCFTITLILSFIIKQIVKILVDFVDILTFYIKKQERKIEN